jgi:hypothetical protein
VVLTSILLALLAGPLLATMAIAIPTSEGILVAADSRARLGQEYCDSIEKIRAVPSPERTMLVATGWTRIYDEGTLPKTGNPCAAIAKGKRILDVARFTQEGLAAKPRIFDQNRLLGIGRDIWTMYKSGILRSRRICSRRAPIYSVSWWLAFS